MPTPKIVLCFILIVIIHAAVAWLANRPQDVGIDAPSGKLMSLSFAPYRDGFSPTENKYPLPEHIDQDLSLLADKTHSIRTYSILGGMQPTPDFARKYGVEMTQGGWLGDGPEGNKKEIEALIDTVNTHPDVVKRIIVGNEVLLRHDMNIDTLISYIRQVKQVVKQPVSYADVWSIYLKYPQLMNEVDFITIHILPYWEDEPISIEKADEHIEKIVTQVTNKIRSMGLNKSILIGESGWPAAGRQRGLAVPGVANQARFIRNMIQLANRHHFDYNIVEAFNQNWKSHNEGVVGANWGLLTIDRKPVFPLTGPVTENPNWQLHFAESIALCLLIAAAYYKKMQSMSLSGLLIFLILGHFFSIGLITLANKLWHTSYSPWQCVYSILIVTANSALSCLLLKRFYRILTNKPSLAELANQLKTAYLFFILLALFKTYNLAFNGRYLSFPVEQFTIPVIGVCGLMVNQWLHQHRFDHHTLALHTLLGGGSPGRHDKLILYLMSFSVLALLIGETKEFMSGYDFIQAHPGFFEGLPFALGYTFYNQQLLSWLCCIFILSIPFGFRQRLTNPKS